MKYFRFKFKYQSNSCKTTGNGTCKGKNVSDAYKAAQDGVARDFGVSAESVHITNLTQYTPKKRKAA